MNPRESIDRLWRQAKGIPVHAFYRQYLREVAEGIPESTTEDALRRLLEHAQARVPYYASLLPAGRIEDPFDALTRMPPLSKDTIRREFPRLQSVDSSARRCYDNTSGGSTGEPVRLVQDYEYAARAGGVTLLYSHLVGRDVGQRETRLWGSERDILEGGRGMKAKIGEWITNSHTVNAFSMTPESMMTLLRDLNRRPPRLLLAYAQAAYELAAFAERKGIEVGPQHAVMTSAGTLYPFMREKMERVFRCPVFNRYGSREVGDIACEGPGCEGLWIAPWGVHVEVLDGLGNRAANMTDGELVVTLLTNYAMPLIRYRIGDMGALAPRGTGFQGHASRVLMRVTGRTVDAFRLRDGTVIDGEYFTHLLYFRDWVQRFQVVQKDYARILVRVVRRACVPDGAEEEIAHGVRAVMGAECRVEFEYCEGIRPSSSGKYRYTITEVN